MLRDQFTQDLKTAMKAGNKRRLSTIRMIQAAIKDKDIENRGAGKDPAGDDEVMALLQKMAKQRAESIAIYETNGRPDLADGEREEAAIIADYLPQALTADEVSAAIDAAIAETGAASMKDMGKVVAKLRADHAGRMDFGAASAAVKAKLSGR